MRIKKAAKNPKTTEKTKEKQADVQNWFEVLSEHNDGKRDDEDEKPGDQSQDKAKVKEDDKEDHPKTLHGCCNLTKNASMRLMTKAFSANQRRKCERNRQRRRMT